MRVTVNKVEKEEGKDEKEFTILINGVKFSDLEDAPVREREPLARSTTSINMAGHKK